MPGSAVLDRPALESTLLVDAEALRCKARIEFPRYVWRGDGDPHWTGQPCEVVAQLSAGRMCEVIFACGCRATVALANLTPA